jgi:hypothetical protein
MSCLLVAVGSEITTCCTQCIRGWFTHRLPTADAKRSDCDACLIPLFLVIQFSSLFGLSRLEVWSENVRIVWRRYLLFVPVLTTFAEVLCFERGKCSLRLFLNRDDVIKSSSLQCQNWGVRTVRNNSRDVSGHKAQWAAPDSRAPLLGTFRGTSSPQAPQNMWLGMSGVRFTFGSEFVTHDSTSVKKTISTRCRLERTVWPASGEEMMGFSTEKSVALLPGRTYKPMVELKGRRSDDITIQKQSQATLTEFGTQDFCKCVQHGANAGLSVWSSKGTTSKGTARSSRYMALS